MDLIASTSILSQEESSELICAVCSQPARGRHFGAVACRACAAFFRRADAAKTTVKPCKKGGNCQNLLNNNGWFDCKFCRLQKCYEIGMNSANFQFDRDPISTKLTNVPNSMEGFLGRPHCVIFVDPEVVRCEKDLIDCTDLLRKAGRILKEGSESPLYTKSNLQKLAEALQKIDICHDSSPSQPVKLVTKYGKEEVFSFFEQDFLKATRWFTYFDEFQDLDQEQKLELIQAIWHVWSRLYKLSTSAIGKRRQICEDKMLMISHGSEYTVMDLTKIEFDFSWCTKYTNEQMQHFIDNTQNSFLYKLVDYMMDLKPSDVELSFMICQACFHYAGQRFHGKMLEICENFQQKLADELHEFYVDEWRMPNYSGRLSQLLRINNRIREDIWKCRKKQEIAEIFDVYSIQYSHPDIFKDI
ncbi:Nuclear Hormone Receptor family [Caenorhabditis elegans]|uniref:Nuclear Hormone Receptor family n=1 Tax=Caenorhabditis elegans TaxID=6239 RepID=O45905_CAEEL|nr:Nuclear Hormone Receptor family [Caenorhabditis elegans]CAA16291.2 Nuclear Hormone Receptor family [Caenorhabditis elegans]|eukprot:NP_507681.2 Nuclear Hormone Receptor family [Caenorhabditis elegans]